MAKYLLICSLLLLAGLPVTAQKIRGLVRNHEQLPLAAATIALLWPDSSIAATVRTGKTGDFTFDSVKAGSYIVQVRYLGYTPGSIAITAPSSHIIHITLQPLAQQLQEVTVQARTPVIEQKIDGLVYNPAADVVGAGSNAQDLVQRVPFVTVNQDGSISVRGGNVRVFINNKPAEFYTNSVPDLLKQLSATDIARIEVITHPSARYDAEGASAVLLIWLKRNRLRGLTGTLNANTNNRETGYNLKLNYRLNKLYGGAEVYQNIYNAYNDERSSRMAGSSFSNQQYTENTFRGRSNLFTAEGGWEPDSTQSLDVQVRLGIFPVTRTQQLSAEQRLAGSLMRAYSRTTDRTGRYIYNTVTTSYTKHFTRNRELVVLAGYNRRYNQSSYTTAQTELAKLNYREKSDNLGITHDFMLQADYIHPFSATRKLETGVKYALKAINSDYAFFSFDSLRGYLPDEQRSVIYHFEQHVPAAYVSYEHGLGKWKLRAGMRYEYTVLKAEQEHTPVTLHPYGTWAPNVLVYRTISAKASASISYARRIRRPEAYHLTPAADYSDSLNITEGNPRLSPEYMDHFEAGLSLLFKNNNSLNVSIYHDYTSKSIQSIRTMKGTVIYNSYANLAAVSRTGASINGILNVGKRFRLSTNLSYYYAEFRTGSTFSLHYLQTSTTATQKLPKDFSLEGNFQWSTPYPFLYGYVGRWFSYYLSANKKFMNGRCAVTLRFNSFFNPYVVTSGMFFGDGYTEPFTRRFRNSLIQLGFSYRFGKAYNTRPVRAQRSPEGL